MLGQERREHVAEPTHRAAGREEQQPLRRGPVAGGEELARPHAVEGLRADAGRRTPDDGEGQQHRQRGVAVGEQRPGGDPQRRSDDVERAARHPVPQAHEEERRRERRAAPDEDLQRVLAGGVGQAGRVVHPGHEDARLAGDEVPEAVDAEAEQQSGHVGAHGEQLADAVDHRRLLRGLGLVVGPRLRLAQSLPHPPGDERDDEQVREDQPAAQQAQGDDRDRQREPDHRPDRPGQLRRAHVTGPAVGRRLLGDERPRGRHPRPDGEAGDHEGNQQHPVAEREHCEEHAGHVDEQVVGVDELAPVAVAQPPPDQRPRRRPERVRAQRGQQADGEVVDPEVLLPQRQTDRDRNDRAGLDVVRHRHRDGGLPT